jgi:hypothetical protein
MVIDYDTFRLKYLYKQLKKLENEELKLNFKLGLIRADKSLK